MKINNFNDILNRLYLFVFASPGFQAPGVTVNIDRLARLCLEQMNELSEDAGLTGDRALREVKVQLVKSYRALSNGEFESVQDRAKQAFNSVFSSNVCDCLDENLVKLIDLKSCECFEELGFSEDKQFIETKVRIIQGYISNFDVESVEARVEIAKQNVFYQLSFEAMDDAEIFFSESDTEFEGQKISYQNSLEGSNLENEIVLYLKNPEVIQLAYEIDLLMKGDLTLQTFARTIVYDYKLRIQGIIHKLGKEIGAGAFADVMTALVLLQENDKFKSAIKMLRESVQHNDSLQFVYNACINYRLVIDSIQRQLLPKAPSVRSI